MMKEYIYQVTKRLRTLEELQFQVDIFREKKVDCAVFKIKKRYILFRKLLKDDILFDEMSPEGKIHTYPARDAKQKLVDKRIVNYEKGFYADRLLIKEYKFS